MNQLKTHILELRLTITPHLQMQPQDLMEELLDAACYLQNEMDEQDMEATELW